MMGDEQKRQTPPHRQRCPTCNAARQGERICRRCKSDLSILVQLEGYADGLRRRAQHCYARGWYRQAASLAQTAVSLESSPENLRLLACACLLSGDFARAWRTAKQLTRSAGSQ
ncbi:MAG: hypothetical protein KAV82_01160 [Phycisphaerae bacterium]|nr:hypothetical protein [Phycisphaerae bacterium]